VILALIFNYFQWTLPLPLDRSVSILSGATVPVLILIMGCSLQNSRWSDHLPALGLANLMRLVAAHSWPGDQPAIPVERARLTRLEYSESAMPSAVVLTVLATEYDIEPAFLTTAVFTSTLLSPLTLTPLLAYLGSDAWPELPIALLVCTGLLFIGVYRGWAQSAVVFENETPEYVFGEDHFRATVHSEPK
jgi:predicted permease